MRSPSRSMKDRKMITMLRKNSRTTTPEDILLPDISVMGQSQLIRLEITPIISFPDDQRLLQVQLVVRSIQEFTLPKNIK